MPIQGDMQSLLEDVFLLSSEKRRPVDLIEPVELENPDGPEQEEQVNNTSIEELSQFEIRKIGTNTHH
ncbi:hypothetical protein GCK32_000245 [Trichostrongylus colubriformis]|uniref:Uncharacterized protein n=1 Tax=Trichostrongylus colubriformis TaxID=6319 RepID=A0AAN8IFE5_TRICO